jgi:glyoxylase-like metal-dependent hydrolase (beta-lactamase superfamily II)
MARAFLLPGARPVLVDTGAGRTARRLLKAMRAHGVDPADLALIVITHSHADHFGGLAALRRVSAARLAAHRLDAPGLPSRPDVLIEDEFNLHEFGIPARVIATPGHTPGSLSVVYDSGPAIVGDLVLPGFLFFGPPAIAFWAWDRVRTLAGIRRILELGPSVIHTTHGGPFSPRQLERLLRNAYRCSVSSRA